MKMKEIEYKGQKVQFVAQQLNGYNWVHFNGETLAVPIASATRKSRRKADGSSAAKGILAPMPGKITKILSQRADEVKKGTAIIVMEAMKMEYTLKAEFDTKIKEIHTQVGDQVVLGQLLASYDLQENDVKAESE